MSAIGTLFITNFCERDIWIWSVPEAASHAPTVTAVVAPRQSYTEPFRVIGGVVSVKMSYEDANGAPPDAVSQLEYTMSDDLYYDWSNINGQPCLEGGFTVRPSDRNPPHGCVDVICKPHESLCPGVYYEPQDIATHACPISTDLVVEICARSF